MRRHVEDAAEATVVGDDEEVEKHLQLVDVKSLADASNEDLYACRDDVSEEDWKEIVKWEKECCRRETRNAKRRAERAEKKNREQKAVTVGQIFDGDQRFGVDEVTTIDAIVAVTSAAAAAAAAAFRTVAVVTAAEVRLQTPADVYDVESVAVEKQPTPIKKHKRR
jgi:hypothetical protein